MTTAFRVGASSGSQGPVPSDTEDTISNVQMDDVSQSANVELPPTSPVPSVTPPSLDQPVETEPEAPHQEVRLPIAPVGGTIHVQDSASWLVNVGYLQGRHGPHDVEALQQTMLKITVSRSTQVAQRDRGSWTFEFCSRQTICQGCRGRMMNPKQPRFAWSPNTPRHPRWVESVARFQPRGYWQHRNKPSMVM